MVHMWTKTKSGPQGPCRCRSHNLLQITYVWKLGYLVLHKYRRGGTQLYTSDFINNDISLLYFFAFYNNFLGLIMFYNKTKLIFHENRHNALTPYLSISKRLDTFLETKHRHRCSYIYMHTYLTLTLRETRPTRQQTFRY